MLILSNPSLRKLEKFVSKNSMQDATILHWTGSMWGIGCRASSITAIERINKLKQRREGQGFIALVPDLTVLVAAQIPAALKPLLEQYWPGNLSVVMPYQDVLLDMIAVNGKIAFRVPADPMLRAFINILGEPVISTSINVTGLMPEEDYSRIEKYFSRWFDYAVLPSLRETRGIAEPSTIIEYVKASEAGAMSKQDELKCLREGSVPFYEVKKSFHMPMVMFVCTANICRSPIAEKLFRQMINSANIPLATDSSGLLPGGHNISLNSLQLLMAKGITEAQEHVSKQLTAPMVAASWLILTMEERHRDSIREKHPNSAQKVFTLNEIVGETGDVDDPHGLGPEEYKVAFDIIQDRLNRLMELITTGKLNLKEIGT